MKKQFQLIRFSLITALLITGLSLNANNNAPKEKIISPAALSICFDQQFSYSWSGQSGAISYTLEIEQTQTQEQFSWETSATSVSAFNIPSGTYTVKVTAKYADNSTSIIIEDLIEH